ncbi:hypothetical protein D3C80_889710 [compost metagenome]
MYSRIIEGRNQIQKFRTHQHVPDPKQQACRRQECNREHKRFTDSLQDAKKLLEHIHPPCELNNKKA